MSPKKKKSQQQKAAGEEVDQQTQAVPEPEEQQPEPEPEQKAEPEQAQAEPEPEQKAEPEQAQAEPEPEQKAEPEQAQAEPEPEQKAEPEQAQAEPEPEQKAEPEQTQAFSEEAQEAESAVNRDGADVLSPKDAEPAEFEAPKILVSHDPTSPSEVSHVHHTEEPHLNKIHVLELLEPVQEQLANMARAADDATTTLNMRMDRLNAQLYEIREEQSAADVKAAENLHSATQHLTNLFVERLNAERKSSEATVEVLNKRIEECYDALSEAQTRDAARLEQAVKESTANNANAISTHAELMQKQLDALVEQCNTTLGVLTQNMHELQTAVTQALTKEILPPGPDIPDGPKIRLVVTFSVGRQSTDVMVPISLNATIGMVKREIIRRASRQNLVGDAVTYSNTILSLDGVVLFEDDTLEDVGISANERMTLGLVSASGVATDGGNSASPPKPQQANAAPKLAPPPALKSPECTSASTSAAVHSTDSDRVVRSFFLDAATATSLADHESLDRRLMIEMARMELEPLAQQEKLERVGIVKTYVNKLRVTLLDRATYSHVEAHRAIARSALEKLNDATARPTVSVEDLRSAQKLAESTLSSITSTDGERDRVDAMNESIRAESGKKSRILQEIKDLIFEIRHRLRIPADLLNRAEKVIDEGERAIILAPSMTSKELDEIHLLMVDFASAVKK